MSELTISNANSKLLHAHLLSTVCAVAVLAATGSSLAEDADRPTVWIELGGQLERMTGSQEVFAPPFLSAFGDEGFDPISSGQRAPRYSYGAQGKLEFDPRGSDWVFSAGIRYGRSNGSKASSQRRPAEIVTLKTLFGGPGTPNALPPAAHLNSANKDEEAHAIIDFQAGKDVGLGLLSAKGSSQIGFGIRFAQFTSSRNTNINGVPGVFHTGTGPKYPGFFASHYHFSGAADVRRSFRGIGPSLSWNSSAPILDRGEDSALEFDWGINAAVLFGRQKVRGQRNITALHYKTFYQISFGGYTIYNGVASSYHHPHSLNRSRSVVVPNIGGFAGLSFRYAAAKVTFGYRGDFFFGPMDEGIDARKSGNVGFHGPFAAIRIGLGG